MTDQLENSDITAVRDAIIDLPNTILSERSLDVDVVSGATTTSNAIIDAISFAIGTCGCLNRGEMKTVRALNFEGTAENCPFFLCSPALLL